MTLTCQHCTTEFKRPVAAMYCSNQCRVDGRRKQRSIIDRKLSNTILSCLTRPELLLLRVELDKLIADVNYSPKVF